MMEKAQELGIEPVNKGKLNSIVIDSPMGKLTIAATASGIAAIGFGTEDFNSLATKLKLTLSNTSTPLLENCVKQLEEYFRRFGTR